MKLSAMAKLRSCYDWAVSRNYRLRTLISPLHDFCAINTNMEFNFNILVIQDLFLVILAILSGPWVPQ